MQRQVRRIKNYPELTAALRVLPVARELVLVMDPTTHADHLVMLITAMWHRGCALPLVWAIRPANTPPVGDRFWTRVRTLLDMVLPSCPSVFK